MNVTEKIIAKSGLSKEEARVIRVFYDLPTAGKKTKLWVKMIGHEKHSRILYSGKKKIKDFLEKKNGAGN